MKSFEIIQRTTATGEIMALPVATIEGSTKGPEMAIVAAVHGCEYCGIEAAIRLYQDLDPNAVSGTVRMVMCANLPAFRARTMYRCPIDGGNVGRSYPGSPTGTYSELIVHTIWNEVVGDAEYLLDLHGGDLIEILTPYIGYNTTGDKALDEKSQAFAAAFGAWNIEVRPLDRSIPKYAFSQAGPLTGRVGLLVESGSQGRRDESDVLFQYNGILNLMKHVGILDGTPTPCERPVRMLDAFLGVTAGAEGIFYPAVMADDLVDEGQMLGEIRDFTGNVLETLTSPARAVVLGVITPASTYEGSMLFGLGRVQEIPGD